MGILKLQVCVFYTEIAEVNSSAFVYKVFHDNLNFSSVDKCLLLLLLLLSLSLPLSLSLLL